MRLRDLALCACFFMPVAAGAQSIDTIGELTAKGFEHYQNKNYAAAADYLGQIVDMVPADDQARYYLIFSLYNSGKTQEALYHTRYLASKYPDSAAFKNLLKRVEESARDFMTVMKEKMGGSDSPTGVSKETVLELPDDPDNPTYEMHAPKLSTTTRDITPPKPKTELELAMAKMDENLYGEADAMLRNMVRKNPKDYEAWHQLGVIDFTVGNYSTAIKNFTKALNVNPTHFQSLFFRGDSYKSLGNYSKAESDYSKAVQIRKDPFALLNLAEVMTKLSKIQKAEQVYNEILTIDKNFTDAKAGLAQLKIIQGNNKEALDIVNSCLQSGEVTSEIKYIRAVLMFENQLYADAIKECDALISDNPGSSLKYEILKGKSQLQNYDVAGALKLAQSIQDNNPDNLDAKLITAEAMSMAGSNSDARAILRSVEKSAKMAETSRIFAKVEANSKNAEEAKKHYDEYIKRSKGQPKPMMEYARYLASIKDDNGAKKTYRKVITSFPQTDLAAKAHEEMSALK